VAANGGFTHDLFEHSRVNWRRARILPAGQGWRHFHDGAWCLLRDCRAVAWGSREETFGRGSGESIPINEAGRFIVFLIAVVLLTVGLRGLLYQAERRPDEHIRYLEHQMTSPALRRGLKFSIERLGSTAG
jgi:hypothetical protein